MKFELRRRAPQVEDLLDMMHHRAELAKTSFWGVEGVNLTLTVSGRYRPEWLYIYV